MARNIQRYLADEVVEARPPSTGYSARFKSGFAESGDEVVVVGFDAFGLIVEKPGLSQSSA